MQGLWREQYEKQAQVRRGAGGRPWEKDNGGGTEEKTQVGKRIGCYKAKGAMFQYNRSAGAMVDSGFRLQRDLSTSQLIPTQDGQEQ